MEQPYHTSLTTRTPANAPGDGADILENARKNLGFVPNLYGNMANHPGLLATYVEGYNRFRKESGFTAVEQEVVFLTISRMNECDYCMAAHSMLAREVAGADAAVVEALRRGQALPDSKLASLAQFTEHLVETRGRPSLGRTTEFFDAGYTEAQVLAVVLALAVKTLSNFTNHLFEPALDTPFKGHAWSPNEA